jgi:hypothetical protein
LPTRSDCAWTPPLSPERVLEALRAPARAHRLEALRQPASGAGMTRGLPSFTLERATTCARDTAAGRAGCMRARGGTDLLPNSASAALAAGSLVDLSNVPEIAAIVLERMARW